MTGGSRAFLGLDGESFAPATTHSWMDISFRQLELLDHQLSFTVDLSNVGCGCNGARRTPLYKSKKAQSLYLRLSKVSIGCVASNDVPLRSTNVQTVGQQRTRPCSC